MTERRPDFDIDMRIGAQAELWVSNICDCLGRGNGTVEVKAPRLFLQRGSPFIEFQCRGRDGVWRPSGIATTKSTFYALTFGLLPGVLIVETAWLRRAARRAYASGQRVNCNEGSNPTRGVYVTFADLFATKPDN